MVWLILALVALVSSLTAGYLWYKQRQRKDFIVLAGCLATLLPVVMFVSAICSIVWFLHWLFKG
jgi:hypothetical protein